VRRRLIADYYRRVCLPIANGNRLDTNGLARICKAKQAHWTVDFLLAQISAHTNLAPSIFHKVRNLQLYSIPVLSPFSPRSDDKNPSHIGHPYDLLRTSVCIWRKNRLIGILRDNVFSDPNERDIPKSVLPVQCTTCRNLDDSLADYPSGPSNLNSTRDHTRIQVSRILAYGGSWQP